MARRSDSELAAALLTQRLVDGPAAPLKASEYWSVLGGIDDPARLLGLDPAAVATTAGVDADMAMRIEQLLAASTAFALAAEELERSGLRVLPSVHADYPARFVQRLGRAAPPILYIAGDVTLLDTALVGIVGSRDVDPAAGEAAMEAAREAGRHGHGVVSGGAKGVDRLAMNAALEVGAPVVGILADSLIRATREPDVRRAIVDGHVCLCSPYKPSAGFTVANAMGRNKLIYALSQATFVVASDHERGGTWAGATEALRQRTAPVLAWTGAGSGDGNEPLVRLGALPVSAVDQLFPLPVDDALTPEDQQLRLGL